MPRRLILALMLVAFLAFDSWVTYQYFTSKFPGANDFYSRYGGARAFWVDRLDPYGDQASLQIQMGIYGRVAGPSEDPGYFAYPFYTVFLVGPLTVLPYPWAEAIWLSLLEACLVGAFLLLLNLFGWRPPRWLLILGVVWSLVFYPATRGLFLGQPGIVVYFLEVLTLWALARQHDTLAGAALAISTIKPQMGFLIVPFLVLWGIRTRRWRFVGSFIGLWGVLMLTSFVVQPSWFGEWLNQLRQYPTYTAIGSPVWVITNVYLPFLGSTGELVIDALLVIPLLWAWYRVLLRGDQAKFDWTVALTLTITHLIAPRTATPHYVVFVLVFVFYFREMIRRDPKDGLQLVAGIMISTTIILWVLFLTTLSGKFEHPINYLPLPFGALIALLVWRRRWWESRPTIRAGDDNLVPVNSAA
ncbi:MAG: DUF2029 domain-containing protein [Anaerolineae bacterium]|nr:DUF2029 domain-containing protein [Anaerolineae bacterium]